MPIQIILSSTRPTKETPWVDLSESSGLVPIGRTPHLISQTLTVTEDERTVTWTNIYDDEFDLAAFNSTPERQSSIQAIIAHNQAHGITQHMEISRI